MGCGCVVVVVLFVVVVVVCCFFVVVLVVVAVVVLGCSCWLVVDEGVSNCRRVFLSP